MPQRQEKHNDFEEIIQKKQHIQKKRWKFFR